MSDTIIKLAQSEAESLRRQFPAILNRLPVSASAVARAMGIVVDVRPGLGEPGRLEQVIAELSVAFTIRVSADLPTPNKRVVVAHEIGHAVLASRHAGAARQWQVRRREEFAHAFARELLIPPAARADLAEAFRIAPDPGPLVALSGRLGLPPAVVFAFAGVRSWSDGLNRVWMRVALRSNSVTGRDPKLRVAAAIYDRHTSFLPLNIGVARLGLQDDWLLSLREGVSDSCCAEFEIWARSVQNTPRFKRMSAPALVSAFRLRSARATGPNFMVIADYKGGLIG